MKNIEIVNKFLKDRKLEDEAILGLEVFEQIYNGEYENDMGNQPACIETLKRRYAKANDFSQEDKKAWEKVRGTLKFDKPFVFSILPESIKDEAEDIINAYAD